MFCIHHVTLGYNMFKYQCYSRSITRLLKSRHLIS